MFHGITDSLKSFGDKATSLFEHKKDQTGDIAEETSHKTSKAASDAKSGAKDLSNKAGEKADNAGSYIKDHAGNAKDSVKDAANCSATKMGNAKDKTCKIARVKLENGEKECAVKGDSIKAGFKTGMEEGKKSAEKAKQSAKG